MRRLSVFRNAIAVLAMFVSFSSSAPPTIREGVGYLLGEEDYVYGLPLVMMDVTMER